MALAAIGKLLATPFRLLGRAGVMRAAEMGTPSLFHPEQILSRTPRLNQLWQVTVKEKRMANLLREHFIKEVDDIVKTYKLTDEGQVDQFLALLEFPHYNKRMPTRAEFSIFPRNIQEAATAHLERVEDPIWKLAKAADPKIGYVAGHFTHFPIKSRMVNLTGEIKRIKNMLSEIGNDPAGAHIKAGYQLQLDDLTRKQVELTHQDASLNALRYQQLPEGGRFGPLSEARKADKWTGYRRDYKEVMHEYVDGAMRKVFLDRYMKKAIPLVKSEPNTALRQYAFDYVTAQRGALAAHRKVFLNESLAQLFPDPEAGYKWIAKGVDVATRFQYLSKIGLSWFRFPFVNSTQPLLTTYPLVGAKHFMGGYLDAFMHPQIWKEARDVGVVFEATLRKGVAEALGRGVKLSKWERGLSWPAKISEELNRVVSYAAGKRQAVEMGLQGNDIVEHGINLVNRTQFLYQKEAMPLIMSRSPLGRLIFQFRTFTANYVNYLTQLVRNEQWPEFARAVGVMATLSGTSAVPFGLWRTSRELLLRKAGVDIGELNPVEWATEKLGFSPPLDMGQSLEPFNPPGNIYQVFGPSAGPVLQLLFEGVIRRPEEFGEQFERFYESISPPVTKAVKGVFEREARTDPSRKYMKGRVIGRRGIPEIMYLRPPLESVRRRYIGLVANAMVGGREDLAKKFKQRLRDFGILWTSEEERQARAMATRLKGVPKVP